ncbi:MAG: MFS transporter [Planctomycetes bacterium]|nr:MFS transporter [Planctomycetota bacterium]
MTGDRIPQTDNPNATPAAARPAGLLHATRVRYWVLTFLVVLTFLTYYDRQCFMRAVESIQSDLNLSKQQIGLIMGAFWLAYALFELPGGWMGDRFGARTTLTRIVMAWSLLTSLTGMCTGFTSLFLCRFLFGVGEAGAFPNIARVQSRWLPIVTREWAGGLLWLSARWGGAFAPLIFGALIAAFESSPFRGALEAVPGLGRLAEVAGWRWAFIASGLLGAIWVIFFWPWFRDHPSEKSSVNAAELELITKGAPPEVRGHTMPPGMWQALLTNRSLWAMGMFYLCGSFGWSFFGSWMLQYFKEVQHVSYSRSAWMAAAPMFLGGISCLVGGILSRLLIRATGWRRLGRAIFPFCGALTAAAAMYAVPYMNTPLKATVLLCVVYVAYDFGQGANWSSIIDIGGRYAGLAAGMINLIGNIGNAAQPYVGAFIIEKFGWPVVFGVYSMAFLLAGSMWLLIDPRRTFYEGRPNLTPDS